MKLDPIKEAEAVKRLIQSLGALAEDDPDFVADTVEGETSLFEAIDAIMEAIDEDHILVTGIKARSDELADRRRRLEKRIEFRRAVIEQAMSVAELPTAQLPGYTITLSARPAQMVVTDEALIPSQYFKAEPKLDRSALKEALKAGADIPGASLDNAAPSLSIRRK